MIHEDLYKVDIVGRDGEFPVTKYTGNDRPDENTQVLEWIEKMMHKDVKFSRMGKTLFGTVIGVEINHKMHDNYLMVYVPADHKIYFELTAELVEK